MHLILCRHGNTFRAGEQVVWVGARTDLPLTETGVAQATEIGRAVVRNAVPLSRIYAGPLARTRRTADLIASAIGLAPERVTLTEALREIDYGTWEGRSDAEIREQGGGGALTAWQAGGVWPQSYGWSPDEAEIVGRLHAIIASLSADAAPDEVAALISSNGIFRILAKSLGIAPSRTKMATGAMSLLRAGKGRPQVVLWNVKPAEFSVPASRG